MSSHDRATAKRQRRPEEMQMGGQLSRESGPRRPTTIEVPSMPAGVLGASTAWRRPPGFAALLDALHAGPRREPDDPRQHPKARVLVEAGDRAVWRCIAGGEAPSTTPDLAALLGYSRRSVQLAFAVHVGVPVTRHVRLVRLHCAREDLLRGGRGNVSAVAMRYGIGHFGRFSGLT